MGGRATPKGERPKTGAWLSRHRMVAGVGLRLGIAWGADGCHDEEVMIPPGTQCHPYNKHLEPPNHVTCHTHVLERYREGGEKKKHTKPKKSLPHFQHKLLQKKKRASVSMFVVIPCPPPRHPLPQAVRNDSTPGRTLVAMAGEGNPCCQHHMVLTPTRWLSPPFL